MFIPRIYCRDPLKVDQTITLDEPSSKHLSKVLRIQINDPVIIFDGIHGEYQARVTNTGKKVQAHLDSHIDVSRESPCHIILGQGIARSDKMDFILQKSVELGVSEIYPLQLHKSQVKLSEERLQKKQQHWENIIISASEQSGRTTLPVLHPPMTLAQWLKIDFPGVKIVLDPSVSQPLSSQSHANCTLLIGPESGLNESELQLAQQHQFTAHQLGPRILRTETATVTALSVIQYTMGDLK